MTLKTKEEVDKKFDELIYDYSNSVYYEGDPKRSRTVTELDLKSFLHTQRKEDIEAIEEWVDEFKIIADNSENQGVANIYSDFWEKEIKPRLSAHLSSIKNNL